MLLLVWLFIASSAGPAFTAVITSDTIEVNIKNGVYFPKIVAYLASGGEDKQLKQYFGKNSRISWIDSTDEMLMNFNTIQNAGLTPKGVNFNIYDDSMMKEAISLYKLLATSTTTKIFHLTTAWASITINEGILDYALRLAISDPSNQHINNIRMPPPYIVKPHYYVNGETIRKAMSLKLRNGIFSANEAKIHEYNRIDDTICINSNLSGWDLRGNGCFENLAYFREDIGLNGYYYGIHLSYPFWMSNDELSTFKNDSDRAIEQYYYLHQQLLARYWLEMESNDIPIESMKTLIPNCDFSAYNPDLQYPNGLLFPVRYPFVQTNEEDVLAATRYLKNVDTILNEFAARGLDLISMYGTSLNMTKDNFMNTISKLIRSNVDGIKYGKILRSIYGGQIHLAKKYNPAPSVLHHPETSLRDPIYWNMISYVMDFFDKFKAHTAKHNLTAYETADFEISSMEPTINLSTYFEYNKFNISNIFTDKSDNSNDKTLTFAARVKRMTHSPFTFKFRIDSKLKTPATIRLYLGPKCNAKEDCFKMYNRFYELDTMMVSLENGDNLIEWSSTKSTSKYSKEDNYNLELMLKGTEKVDCDNSYSIMKFPESLVIPKGKPEGFLTSLFVIVTKANESEPTETSCNTMLKLDVDSLPLGFPFDRDSINYNPNAKNYKFFDVTIYEKVEDSLL